MPQVHLYVDGTDRQRHEPEPFSSQWVSQKIDCPTLRYGAEVSLSGGHILWVAGPYPCG